MRISEFISNFKIAFGDKTELPILFWYNNKAIADTPKTYGCFFTRLNEARTGIPLSLSLENMTCGGAKLYTGFAPMNEKIAFFVSIIEKYKKLRNL